MGMCYRLEKGPSECVHLLCWISENLIFFISLQENGEVPKNVLEVRGKSSLNTSFYNSYSYKNVVSKAYCQSGQPQIMKPKDHRLVPCCVLVLGHV